MKDFSILLSIAFISLSLPAEAKELSETHKIHFKKSVRPTQKNSLKKHTKEVASIKAKQRNGLPNTKLDSFVLNSGGLSEAIYGDEGSSGPPPYHGFAKQNLTESGVYIRGLNTENSRQYIYDAQPSFWSDWKSLTGDFDYTLDYGVEPK